MVRGGDAPGLATALLARPRFGPGAGRPAKRTAAHLGDERARAAARGPAAATTNAGTRDRLGDQAPAQSRRVAAISFENVWLQASPAIRVLLFTDVAFNLIFVAAHRGHEIAARPKTFPRVVLRFASQARGESRFCLSENRALKRLRVSAGSRCT